MDPLDPRHGTRAGYLAHLKDSEEPCEPCRTAHIRYCKQWNVRRQRTGKAMTDATASREHIHALLAKGLTLPSVARNAGVAPSMVRRVAAGTQTRIWKSTESAILAVTHDSNVGEKGLAFATPTARRVRALLALGYSFQRQATLYGMSRDGVAFLARGERRVNVRTAQIVAEQYRRLCMVPYAPTAPRERGAATRAKARARANGWAPPLAWDDIDDIDTTPQGIKRRRSVPGRPMIRDRHIEDAEWMADADETLTSACARLGIKPDSLYAACKRAGRVDVYDRLADRETNGLERADMRNRKRDAA